MPSGPVAPLTRAEKKLVKLIGDNIWRLRKELGVSQVELAKKAKVSRDWLLMIEAGSVNPTAAMIERVATALGVPAFRLLKPLPKNWSRNPDGEGR